MKIDVEAGAFDDPFDLSDTDQDEAAPAAVQGAAASPVVGSHVDAASVSLSHDDLPEEPAIPEHSHRNPGVSDELTWAQRRTFTDLLAIGADRPLAPQGLVTELTDYISSGTETALERWGQSLWFSKSMLTEASHCEGLLLASASTVDTRPLHPATMVGIVAHRAIQIHNTHQGESVSYYVREATRASRNEERFAAAYSEMGDAERSDLQMIATSRVISFMDSWPPLRDEWSWRFEESASVRIGRLTLGARMDLVLGRPRADQRQTMLLCDLKTGSLNDDHLGEAAFYALVSTLRWGVPPWRSVVYSLASGEWTDPDVTVEVLRDVASAVVRAVCSRVDVLTEHREPVLSVGSWCSFCPVRSTCSAYAAAQAV